ncbi:MAG TPA: hypothetical protein VFV67_27095 [Actinophytocola sp.]|uniref:hypothetical protein n=1 Tax=Actinophytocola sp. TaxID=1872138 RepID=UPI002DBCBF65|nr:hypothetical protein [Actinophytocola sp.]HEU5474330.1 hypothetical protein [Actinophytocola sp.]
MSNVPQGATLSDDGHYWWDGTDWQLVQDNGDAGGAGGSDGSADAGTPVIVFVDVYAGSANTGPGPRVIVDQDDNPDDHLVLHVDAGCLAVWGEGNAGTADGVYSDSWSLEDGTTGTLDDLSLLPEHTVTRSVRLGRLGAGRHTFSVTLNGQAFGEDRDFDVAG